MTEPLNFQSIIMTLQDFWARQGCMIWQPYYTQVGAGTNNPATALRVLGPEPWHVAYVEPSIRPDDGRYGENPNRMQMHYQFQVILKPDPGNPQEIYLESLQAMGIDPRLHDIRFVEDNWVSPALGAWGLGWEVWLDGQEITQFTYFQQGGGLNLDPVSVEITYGLDRIAIALQRVNSFREIQWNPDLTAGDINLQAEQEHSKYYFEIADVNRLRQMYDLFEAEAFSCLGQGLVLPAFDYVLKCSHTFNVLDTRGAVGVTERQALFGRMREITRRVAEAYVEQRRSLEFPWLTEQGKEEKGGRGTTAIAAPYPLSHSPLPVSPAPFLFEIGTEELPVGDLDAALDQLMRAVPALLDELRLAHGPFHVWGTPRRLVIFIEDLAPKQLDLEQVVKGPPAERAFGPDGIPTSAGLGFARSKGVDVRDLQIREMDGGKYAVAIVRQAGKPAPEVLQKSLPGLVASLRFDKTMRWNASNVAFSRPIRWLLALIGDGDSPYMIPCEYAGIHAGATTRGLRSCEPQELSVGSIQGYFSNLARQGIVLDKAERQRMVLAQVQQLAAQVGGKIALDEDLLAEVANLVESPFALLGSFDKAHLYLPRQVLISVMKKHQRYFHVEKAAGESTQELLPYFITIRNGDHQGSELVKEGNEHVIRARFADADFFVRDDLKKPLEAYLSRLGTLTFQVKLGSMLDKVHRIMELIKAASAQLNLTSEETRIAQRAAELCKADLATKMVVEMTSLQGVMGRYYALQAGESKEVAEAIYEHYLPRFTGDLKPHTRPGMAVGLADRLDTLVGLFAAGLAPSGNKDPFAQRRTALGLVQNLVESGQPFDLYEAIETASSYLPIPANTQTKSAVAEFIVERLRNQFLDEGWRYDVVAAVLAFQGSNPAFAARAVQQLTRWVARPDWNSILPTFARCVRITRDFMQRFPLNESAFREAAEKDLFSALSVAESATRSEGSVDDFLNAFLPMMPVINHFFDAVLVMTEDSLVRENRLGLLQRIAALADGVADMSKLEGF